MCEDKFLPRNKHEMKKKANQTFSNFLSKGDVERKVLNGVEFKTRIKITTVFGKIKLHFISPLEVPVHPELQICDY